MNKDILLYRKRLIPEELIPLKDDIIIYADEKLVITHWNTIKPRKDIAYGYSAFLLDRGYKISKVFDHNDQLVYWYCDIITHTYEASSNSLIIIDLLVDVIVMKDGSLKVLDLDELSEALKLGLLSKKEACKILDKTNSLLKDIYEGRFREYQDIVEIISNKKNTL